MKKYQLKYICETEHLSTVASVTIKAESTQKAYDKFCSKIFNKYNNYYVTIKNNVINIIKNDTLILYYNFKIMEVE